MPRNASTGGPPSPQWSELSFPGRSDPMVHLSERNAVPLAPDAFLSVPYSAGNDHVDPDAIRKFQQLFHTLAVKSLQRAGIVSFCDRGDHKRLGSRAHGLLTVTRISHSETSRIMGRKRPIPQASKTGKRPKRRYGARKGTASTFHSITSRSLMRSAGCFHARMRRRIAPRCRYKYCRVTKTTISEAVAAADWPRQAPAMRAINLGRVIWKNSHNCM